VEHRIATAWVCRACDVEGCDATAEEVRCWCCGGPVTVTARPLLRDTPPGWPVSPAD
jgi:hypothetical protein